MKFEKQMKHANIKRIRSPDFPSIRFETNKLVFANLAHPYSALECENQCFGSALVFAGPDPGKNLNANPDHRKMLRIF
jgi:hypothetical protein